MEQRHSGKVNSFNLDLNNSNALHNSNVFDFFTSSGKEFPIFRSNVRNRKGKNMGTTLTSQNNNNHQRLN